MKKKNIYRYGGTIHEFKECEPYIWFPARQIRRWAKQCSDPKLFISDPELDPQKYNQESRIRIRIRILDPGPSVN